RPFSTRLGDPGWLQVLENPLVVDISHAQQTLGWHPRYNVYSAIARLRATGGQRPKRPWSG
ncbi:MAG: epimerase, partial [Acidithiobacillus ferrivorans]